MATKYARGAGGGSWNTNTDWSTTSSAGGANTTKPVAADTVILDAGAPATVTVDVGNQACAVLNCTGFTGTLLFTTYSLTTTGNVTLVSGMTLNTGTATWNMGCNGVTLTTAGKSFYNLNFSVTGTITLADTCNVGLLSVATGITATLASNNINASGGITVTGTGVITGQTINLSGGTWSGTSTGYIGSTLTITGSVTISGNVYYKTGTITTSSATITWSSSVFIVAGSMTLVDANSGTPNWTSATINFSVTSTLTLSQVTYILNLGMIGSSSNFTFASNNIVVSGNLSAPQSSSSFIGQTIILTGGSGTSIWSGSGVITSNLTFLAGANSITISGTVATGAGVYTYTSGNIITTGTTWTINNNSTLNTAGISWNNISKVGIAGTITLSSALTCTGVFTPGTTGYSLTFSGSYLVTVGSISQPANTLTLSNAMTCTGTYTNTATSIINGAYTLSVGGLTLAYALSGTSTISLTGGTWTASSSSCTLANSLTFAGTVTISGTVYYNGSSLTWSSGTVTGGTLQFNTTCSISGSAGMSLSTVAITYNVAITTDDSFSVATLNMYYLSSLTIPATKTLTVSTAMRLEYCTIQSSTTTPITLTYTGTNNASAFTTFSYVNATTLIYIWNATALTGTSNINSINQPGGVIVID